MILFRQSLGFFVVGLETTLALVLTLTQMVALVNSSPEDWGVAPPTYQISDENKANVFISAFINVSQYIDGTWLWNSNDVGRYGGGTVGPASGVIVHVTSDTDSSDHSGCQLPFRSTRADKQVPAPGEPWIALIKRGKCNFENKVDNAYKSFASGVIVYNDRDSDSLDMMKINDNGRKFLT